MRYDAAVNLTIGIPTYNRADDVRKTVLDVLSHADSDLVHIVVIDDGGTDSTYESLVQDPEIASRLASGVGDLAEGVAGLLRAFRGPRATREAGE